LLDINALGIWVQLYMQAYETSTRRYSTKVHLLSGRFLQPLKLEMNMISAEDGLRLCKWLIYAWD
jgi:hypothetical protein